MKIKGTVSRVIESESRVFLFPDDPADARKLDGANRLASGEVTAPVEDASQFKIGESVEIDVGGQGSEPTTSAPST